MHKTSPNNSTIQRNSNDALKGEKHGEDEADRPDPRTIGIVRSPSAERTNGMQGQTLPVVEELGEASSTGGRSAHSQDRDSNGDIRPMTPAKLTADGRPMTPAKVTADGRPVTPAKDYSPIGNGYGLRKQVSRQSLDKVLPPLPTTASPAPMNEK